jgi:hypothetical protein
MDANLAAIGSHNGQVRKEAVVVEAVQAMLACGPRFVAKNKDLQGGSMHG